MKKRGVLRIASVMAVFLFLFCFNADARTEVWDREGARLKLKAAWESWKTFSCRYECWAVDEQGKGGSPWAPGSLNVLTRRELLKAEGGRWAAS